MNHDMDYEENREAQEPSSGHRSGGRHVKEKTPAARSGGAKKTGKKRGRTKVWVIVLVVLLVLILAVGAGLFVHLYRQMDTGSKKTPETTPTPVTETEPTATPEPTPEPTPTPTPEPLTEEELARQEEIKLLESLQQDAEEIMYDKNVYNLLLLGADGRSDEIERTDAMILVSINKETKKIWLTSFLRDALLTIPGYGEGHLNWATSWGGVDLLIDTLEYESNYAIHIDNWALVNFLDFAELAEMVGPISATVSAEELEDLNGLIREACQYKDAEIGYVGDNSPIIRHYFESEGTFEISDGFQILGYCRERYYGGNTGRGARQRDALMQMWGNVKKMSLKEMYELMEEAFSIVHTDLTMGQCMSLLLQVPSMLNYDIYSQQAPVDGGFWKGRDDNNLGCYHIDFGVNRNFLRATIYNEEMSAADLTSYWTGEPRLVWWPEEENEG